MRWPHKIRRRIEHAEKAAEKNAESLAVTESRWDEVRELAGWAREAREANHLTELFINGLHGKKA